MQTLAHPPRECQTGSGASPDRSWRGPGDHDHTRRLAQSLARWAVSDGACVGPGQPVRPRSARGCVALASRTVVHPGGPGPTGGGGLRTATTLPRRPGVRDVRLR